VKSLSLSATSLEEYTFEVALEGAGGQLTGPVHVALRYLGINANQQINLVQNVFLARFDALTYTNVSNNVTTVFENFANTQFQPLKIAQNGSNFQVTATDINNIFQLVVHVVSNVTTVNQTPIRPTSVKFDVNINKTKTNQLNLQTTLFSDQEIANFSDPSSVEQNEGFSVTQEKQIAFGAGAIKNAFFSWVLSATIGGTTIPVIDSPAQSQTANSAEEGFNGYKKAAVFSFPTALTGALQWDPKVGQETFTDSAVVTSGSNATPSGSSATPSDSNATPSGSNATPSGSSATPSGSNVASSNTKPLNSASNVVISIALMVIVSFLLL